MFARGKEAAFCTVPCMAVQAHAEEITQWGTDRFAYVILCNVLHKQKARSGFHLDPKIGCDHFHTLCTSPLTQVGGIPLCQIQATFVEGNDISKLLRLIKWKSKRDQNLPSMTNLTNGEYCKKHQYTETWSRNGKDLLDHFKPPQPIQDCSPQYILKTFIQSNL